MLPLRDLLERYFQQRSAARRRGIVWELDFWDWLRIWENSGHLYERGRRKGQFQMCRAGDAGPYCSTNVRIDRMEANASEGQITKRRIRLERQASQSLYGGATARAVLSTTISSS